MRSSAQLLVLSPDSTLRRAALRCVESMGHTALVASTVDEAQQIMSRVQIDLVCLDSLLLEDEAEQLRRWLDAGGTNAAPPLVLLAPRSTEVAPSTVPAFLRRQGVGRVGKPLERSELVAEITRLLAERPRADDRRGLLRLGALALDAATRQLLLETGGSVALTPIEYRLLRRLMEHPGEFVSAAELLEDVWGYPHGTGGPELVRAHVSNVRRKLRLLGEDPQLLRTLPQRGYALVAGEPASA